MMPGGRGTERLRYGALHLWAPGRMCRGGPRQALGVISCSLGTRRRRANQYMNQMVGPIGTNDPSTVSVSAITQNVTQYLSQPSAANRAFGVRITVISAATQIATAMRIHRNCAVPSHRSLAGDPTSAEMPTAATKTRRAMATGSAPRS
jgi:hypothetical protein